MTLQYERPTWCPTTLKRRGDSAVALTPINLYLRYIGYGATGVVFAAVEGPVVIKFERCTSSSRLQLENEIAAYTRAAQLGPVPGLSRLLGVFEGTNALAIVLSNDGDPLRSFSQLNPWARCVCNSQHLKTLTPEQDDAVENREGAPRQRHSTWRLGA